MRHEAFLKHPMLGELDAEQMKMELLAIEKADGNITPKAVVAFAAQNASSELHKAFDWDDSSAAEKYRETVARAIVRTLYITHKPRGGPARSVRVFVRPPLAGGYQSMKRVAASKILSANVSRRALLDLQSWCRRYDEVLAELPLIRSAVTVLVEGLSRAITEQLKAGEEDAAE